MWQRAPEFAVHLLRKETPVSASRVVGSQFSRGTARAVHHLHSEVSHLSFSSFAQTNLPLRRLTLLWPTGWRSQGTEARWKTAAIAEGLVAGMGAVLMHVFLKRASQTVAPSIPVRLIPFQAVALYAKNVRSGSQSINQPLNQDKLPERRKAQG